MFARNNGSRLLRVHLRIVQHAAGKQDVALPAAERIFERHALAGRLVRKRQLRTLLERVHDPADLDLVIGADCIVISLVRKGERQDAEVDQVRGVNALKGFGDHGLDAEVHGADGSMLPARSLAVARAGDHDVMHSRLLVLQGLLRECCIESFEHEFGILRDI